MLLLAMMAAFGTACALKVLFGLLLPKPKEGILLCSASNSRRGDLALRKYIYLKDLGLLDCTLVVVDQGLSETERKWLLQKNGGIEIIDPEELPRRLELERNRIDRTGNGDHSGRDQRRGVSEL